MNPPVQGELFKADAAWFPVLRALIRTGAMARLGPYGIAAYLAIKAEANLKTGKAAVSVRSIADNTGMSERSAREAIRRLEREGLVSSAAACGKPTTYQLIERLSIVTADGRPAGAAEWPFSSTEWRDQLKRVVAAAIEQLANGQARTTINIGSINVLVVQEPRREVP
ncbi:helix-turn-helix domain-containing protein [Solimonas soli]|uniref:helix-turn-helix domain-containing protein n=1 Tax=Solimonas soli TaxID=413479 RepID=UPI00146FAED9|nr:helix-turn-helix domain-containing protein [Solimonas soli]